MSKRRTLPHRRPQTAVQPAPNPIPEQPQQAVENRGGFLRRILQHEAALLSGLVLLFGVYYFWTASPCSTWHVDCSPTPVRTKSGEIIGPYNVLASSFLAGQLSLLSAPDPRLLRMPDPYDPRQNFYYKLHDMSLYNGNYYVPFGPAPALMLYVPFQLLTGAYLPDAVGCAVFALGTYILACLALRLFLKKLFPALAAWVFPFLCVGLGFCNIFPFLLRRPAAYEIAIIGGQFFLMAALLLSGRVIFGASRRPKLEAAGAGSMAALAFASRPSLLLPACGLLVLFLIAPTPSARSRRELLAWTLAPFLAGGLLVAWYNYARFGSPFEFGYHYQLAGIRTDENSYLQTSRSPMGLYFYLFCPPTLSSTFPYVHLAKGAPFAIPPEYSVRLEPIAGIVWFSPLVLLLLAPWFWKPRDEAARSTPAGGLKKWVLVLVSSSIAIFWLDGGVGATMRYEADVSSLLFLAASLAGCWLLLYSPPRVQKLAPGALIATVSLGIVMNAAIGITGCYDLLKQIEPSQYRAIESFFKPVTHLLAGLGIKP